MSPVYSLPPFDGCYCRAFFLPPRWGSAPPFFSLPLDGEAHPLSFPSPSMGKRTPFLLSPPRRGSAPLFFSLPLDGEAHPLSFPSPSMGKRTPFLLSPPRRGSAPLFFSLPLDGEAHPFSFPSPLMGEGQGGGDLTVRRNCNYPPPLNPLPPGEGKERWRVLPPGEGKKEGDFSHEGVEKKMGSPLAMYRKEDGESSHEGGEVKRGFLSSGQGRGRKMGSQAARGRKVTSKYVMHFLPQGRQKAEKNCFFPLVLSASAPLCENLFFPR